MSPSVKTALAVALSSSSVLTASAQLIENVDRIGDVNIPHMKRQVISDSTADSSFDVLHRMFCFIILFFSSFSPSMYLTYFAFYQICLATRHTSTHQASALPTPFPPDAMSQPQLSSSATPTSTPTTLNTRTRSNRSLPSSLISRTRTCGPATTRSRSWSTGRIP